MRPPAYLRQALGIEEAPAAQVGAALEAAMAEARCTLEALRDPGRREALVRQRFAAWSAERTELDAERRRLAADPQRRPEATAIWQRLKDLDRRLAEAQAEWVLQLLRLLDVAYYDSRGALLPWCLALEGETLYRRMLAQAEIVPEGA